MVSDKEDPRRFFWFKRWVNVSRIIDRWKEIGRWWEDDAEKLFFRILSREGEVYEIYSEKQRWNLYKVYD